MLKLKATDVLLAIATVLALACLGKVLTYFSESNHFEKSQRPRLPVVTHHYEYDVEEDRGQREEQARKWGTAKEKDQESAQEEIDWSWLRKGARMYNDDGTLLRGGPVQVKQRKIPVVYGDPSKGQATSAVPASEQSSVDPLDLRDQAWDRAFELSDTMEPGDY